MVTCGEKEIVNDTARKPAQGRQHRDARRSAGQGSGRKRLRSAPRQASGEEAHGCLDCRHCWATGAPCVQKDDMGEVHEAIADADVVVLASPLYFYSWSTQIKPVWDRLLPFFAETRKSTCAGRRRAHISGGRHGRRMLRRLKESFKHACGYTKWEIAGEIYALGMYPKDAVANEGQKYIEEAYELGKRL